MTIKHAYNRFKEFGGWRLVFQYAKMGMLGVVIKDTLKGLLKGKSLNEIYSHINVDHKLLKQYNSLMEKLIKEYSDDEGSHTRSKTIWSSWWQGEEEAPQLVKACWASQRKYMPDGWQHIIITNKNYKDYISIPNYILKKKEKGIIPQAMFSDLVRLELLIKYGGIWMDSTVLCTEPNYPQTLLTCPLFLFQYRRTSRVFFGFSNWFISAESNNKTLKIVKALLYQYWRDYDCVVKYFVFHLFINTLARKISEILKQMPVGISWPTLLLGEKLAEPFDEQWWNEHNASCCFHKLNYRKENDISNSYCNHIIKTFNPNGSSECN